MAIDYPENEMWQHVNRFTVYVLKLFSRKFWSGGTQIRRSAISVTTNITQRLGREALDGRELSTAKGELWESHYLISLAYQLHVINTDEYETANVLARAANTAIEDEQTLSVSKTDEHTTTEASDETDNIPF